jgi:small GTP-binding protein
MDTAGTEDLQSYYISSGEGFVIVYSITSKRSFDDTDRLRDQIINGKYDDKTPIVFCGNKCDLKSDREVSTADGAAKAKKYDALFYETSARLKTNIEESFTALVREVRKHNNEVRESSGGKKPPKPGCCLL